MPLLAAAAPAPAARATAAADVDTDVDQRGRRSRRPQAADDSTPGGVRGRQSPDSSEDGDAEVQAVLSKLVGGLTRSGRKATARRIVEDALCAVRRHLKKGGVEDLK
ncbi:hypothetical protein HXX76_015108 [Chlamydomonas incerta]|uniref:Uncharacterized protein n=1 Tax=Chlamydomonas incerta TaxID=51695 RepID=A0A835VS10_CHLIN|nr:hypothetical protein HXX76_015108 [Chlamydomonas incerta]|eukprot:KAG2423718.1 hypothetical protein HXX76_015108 [Chlamydomonas incerta]